MKKIIFIFTFFVLLTGCSPFQKALKSEDIAVKFDLGTKLYDSEKYSKAIRLFEQIAPSYRGKPQAEKMFYMYAQSFYKTKQYYISAGRFESFVASYPKSDKVEEASFLEAVSFSKASPVYSLDQTETIKGVDKMQDFINQFPNSTFLPEANEIAKNLREKLEKKAYEIAYQYNRINDHKSAIIALDNFLIDFPGTQYKEKALFHKFESTYIVAENSFLNKMQERLSDAKLAYTAFAKNNSTPSLKSKADDMMAKIDKDLQQFSKQ